MIPLAWRPFLDPADWFTGPGWLWFLPPLLFASAWVYHALRSGDGFAWGPLWGRSLWTGLKGLLVLAVLAAVLRWL